MTRSKGTPGFRPPEMQTEAARSEVSCASDLFSIGAVLHWMLVPGGATLESTISSEFTGDSRALELLQRLTGLGLPPNVQRYSSADDVLHNPWLIQVPLSDDDFTTPARRLPSRAARTPSPAQTPPSGSGRRGRKTSSPATATATGALHKKKKKKYTLPQSNCAYSVTEGARERPERSEDEDG